MNAGDDAPIQAERLLPSQQISVAANGGTSDDAASPVHVIPDVETLSLDTGKQQAGSSTDKNLVEGESKEEPEDPTKISEKPGTPESSIGTAADSVVPRSPRKGDDGVDPSATLPISSDDFGGLAQSTTEVIAAKQIPGGARTIHLPPKVVQEYRSRHGHEGLANSESLSPRSLDDTRGSGAPGSSGKDQDAARSAASTQSEDPLDGHVINQTRSNNVLQSQMDIVRADAAFAGTPATPDEQLRLEEAQALQFSGLPSSLLEGNGGRLNDPTDAPDIGAIGLLGKSDQDQPVEAPSPPVESIRQDHVADTRFDPSQAIEPLTPGLRENTFSAFTGGLPKDLTFSRRPPMRIDTAVAPASDSLKSVPSRKTTTPGTTPCTPSEPATGTKSGTATSQVHSPPERMTTRVSSGALRHKSVSEILGETPRHTTFQSDKGSSDKTAHESQKDEVALQTPRSAISVTSPDTTAFKQRLNELKEKERSKLSTVVFARQQNSILSRNGDSTQVQQEDDGERQAEPNDYLLPLFTAQAAVPVTSQSLHSLVVSAHKTLTTADHYVDSQEQQDCRILTKIYHLQSANRWSLRQTERSVEPSRPKAHWDVLLSQMKWMRTDFREERKWKLAAAKTLADACAQWVASPLEERTFLQVKFRSRRLRQESHSIVETPELVPSAEDDSDTTDCEGADLEVMKHGAPASIFSSTRHVCVWP